MPLALAEHQAYIHYNKGGMVMYALRDLIGEQRVNRALRSLLGEQRFRGPPYATTRDLVRHLRQVTPDSMQHAITDLFETVTLYENRAISATSTQTSPGHWRVDVEVEARKLRADTVGNETSVPVDDWIDVGVTRQGPGGNVLELRKEHITAARTRVSIDVTGKPLRAGIDPAHKLIDRRGTDNVIPVVERAAAPSSPRPRRNGG
jgi:hypothetical protein